MEDGFVQRFLDIHIAGRYQLHKRLGAGTFGQVYHGTGNLIHERTALTQRWIGRDVHTGDEVAIKLEHYRIAPSFLDQEVEIYESLAGRPGFPRVLWHGSQDDFRVMVFDLLGPNLEDLFRYCGNRFSMKTTLMLMDQLLRQVESLHATGHHHRDIKPENFLLGTGKRGNVVYMTDLGLASYRQTTEKRAVLQGAAKPPRPSLIGTCRYASINGHMDVGKCRAPSSCILC
jgi:serine/threonine protein kinase